LYISLLAARAAAQESEAADALYAGRANPASARTAVDLLDRLAGARPADFEVAWKLARACYWMGEHAAPDARRGFLERGVSAAERARRLQADRPEGHFWLAANMGALAESFGLRMGLRYRKPIKEALETVQTIDPAFMEGAADRALGRWYFRVPRLFGGDKRAAEAHLLASLRYDPDSTIGHYFLAELYLETGRTADARSAAQAVLDAPLSADWAPEDEEYKARARALLTRIR